MNSRNSGKADFKFTTRQDFEDCLVRLCNDVSPFFSADKTQLDLGVTKTLYDDQTIGMEGFSRLLWGLVPLWSGGDSQALADTMLTGIRNGTNPDHPGYWGVLGDDHQMFVEMAAIALSLMMTPEKLWEPLSEAEKEALNSWLLQINDYQLPQNNWYFFRILVNTAFFHAGGRFDRDQVEQDFALIESCYLGDGWYSDGRTLQRDYYISFAMHYYSLIYTKFMRDRELERCGRMVARAELFAKDFIYWFTETGEALPYGRSLTYRFAQCAFWSALAFAGVEVYSWGVVKGIINRHFRYWFAQPILDTRGILTIGYSYPNLNMAEGYNAPGSPYWSFKSFLVLALPDAHPFWQAEEEPLPRLEPVKQLEHPMMVITRPARDHLVALTSGQYPGFEPVHSAEKYAKFAYSSRYAFHVPRSYRRLEAAAPDNMLAFVRDGLYFVRRQCERVEVADNRIISVWSPCTGIVVETILEPYQNGHRRTHKIRLDFDCEAVECGFGIPVDSYRRLEKLCDGTTAQIATGRDYSRMTLISGGGRGGTFLAEANTNLLHPRTAIPYFAFDFTKGEHIISLYVEAGEV